MANLNISYSGCVAFICGLLYFFHHIYHGSCWIFRKLFIGLIGNVVARRVDY